MLFRSRKLMVAHIHEWEENRATGKREEEREWESGDGDGDGDGDGEY